MKGFIPKCQKSTRKKEIPERQYLCMCISILRNDIRQPNLTIISPIGSSCQIILDDFSDIVSSWCIACHFLEQSSSNIQIYILYTFFSCCTFKSHALLETAFTIYPQSHDKVKIEQNSIQDNCCIFSTLEYQTDFLCKPTV